MWNWFPDQQKTVTFYSISEMREERPDWFRDDLSQLFQLAVQGQIKPIVWKTLPLAEAAEAHRMIENHEVRGKIVLRVADRE
jgi:NADPH:quinone reductase-like Zn-dependent oxidoreductase